MKNLLPDFILENYKNNLFHGEIEAFTMFIDISGFTPMTEKLMKGDNEGAEILSEILKNIFKPTVKQVYESGGFITNFAGDAFTSIFPFNFDKKTTNNDAKKILICADNIIKEFENSGIQKTSYGSFHLRVKLGLSFGKVEWAIIGENHKSFYFRGEAISGCAIAQMNANENELIIDNKFLKAINDKKVILEKRGNYYFARNIFENESASFPHNGNPEISNLAKQIFSKNFFPETIFSVKDTGEFRNVVSVFISFDGNLPKEFIDSLFRIIIYSVNHYHGYLKDIDFGDKGGVIVCYFGAPVSYEEDINRALSFIKFTKGKLSSNSKLSIIKIKAGITYGKVFSGYIGSDQREQYSVLGDVVNLSARFMSKAEWNEVWVSAEIFERAKNKNGFILLGNFQFKGFSKEIPVYKLEEKDLGGFLKSKREILGQSQQYLGLELIGREDELKILNDNVKKIFNKKSSGVIYILGEAGIGKSRLIKEFRKEFSESNKITWLYCYTSEILQRPLSPFKYLLKNFFKQSDGNTSEENKRIFDNIIDIIIKRLEIIVIENKRDIHEVSQIESELERTRSILASMIDIYWDNSLYEQLDPDLRFENTKFAFCNLVMAECVIQPVVIEIEDIHWLDKDSAEVLKMLLNNVVNLPLAIICTSRYLYQSKKIFLEIDRENFKIELNYFSLEHIKNFAEKILEGKVDDKAVNFIHKNTNGNPYFVEQLILDLKERNIWKKKNNSFMLAEYDNLNIPSSINSVLISRFDRLPDKVKEVVQTASVLGREFEFRILQQMFENDKDLDSKLKLAEEDKIWFVTEGKYIFTHALLCDSVYSMQMKTYLRSTHLIAAEAYKKFAGKKVSQSIEEHIAYHFGIGHNFINSKSELVSGTINLKKEEDKKIAEEFLKLQLNIADKYKTDYRNEKALEIYDLILGLLRKLNYTDQEYFILLKKVEILNNISKWKEAELVVEKAIGIADKLKDKGKKMLSMRYLGEVCYYKNEFIKSEKLFKDSLKYFKSKRIISEVIDTTFNLGNVYFVTGNYKKAWSFYQESYRMAKKFGNKFQVAESLASIARLFAKMGDETKALQYSKKAFIISRKINYKRNVAILMSSFGNNFYSKGELQKALLSYENSVKLYEEVGNRSGLAQILENIGNIHFVRSEFEKARQYYNRQFEIVKSLNDNLGLASAYGCMGRLSAVVNDYTKALKYNKAQYKLNKKLKRRDALGVPLGNIGKMYFDMGQYSKAIIYFSRHYKISSSINQLNGMQVSLMNLGTVYLSKENFAKAREFYDKALKLTSNKFLNLNTFTLLGNYTELLTKIKKYDEALMMCSKILTNEKLCPDKEMINLSKISREKIMIYILFNRIINKPALEKSLKKNIFKIISKIEMFIEDLSKKEYIADAHYNLVEILFLTKSLNMNHPKEKDYRKNAIIFYKELISLNPVHTHKIQLRNILKNKF